MKSVCLSRGFSPSIRIQSLKLGIPPLFENNLTKFQGCLCPLTGQLLRQITRVQIFTQSRLKIHFSILNGKFAGILHKILLGFSLIQNNWPISTLSVKTAQRVKRGVGEHKGFLQIKGTMSTNRLSSHLQLGDYYSFCKPFSLKTKSRMVESR